MEACGNRTVSGKFPAHSLRHRQRTTVPVLLRFQRSQPPAKLIASSMSMESDRTDIITSDPQNRMFILGMGYVGQFVAQELKKDGCDCDVGNPTREDWQQKTTHEGYLNRKPSRIVSGTCTSITKKKELEEKGFDVCLYDAHKPEWKVLDTLRDYSHLLVSIPPALVVGDPMLQHEGYLKDHLAGASLRWLCYLSSTSVYGDCKGALVNEDSTPNPTTKLSEVRLNAEERWLKMGHELGLSSVALRLGGIYGPGRSAVDTILKQEQLSEGQKRRASRKYTSRVHVADICQAVIATIRMPFISKLYNIVDDDPASRAEVFAFAQKLIKERWPGVINPMDLHLGEQPLQGFTVGEKRVSNSRMKVELGVKLFYPSYIMGLKAIIDQIEHPTC